MQQKNKPKWPKRRLIQIINELVTTIDVGDNAFNDDSTWLGLRKNILSLTGELIMEERIQEIMNNGYEPIDL